MSDDPPPRREPSPAPVTAGDSWQELARLSHDRAVRCVAFSSDGSVLYSADKAAWMWEVASGRELFRFGFGSPPILTFQSYAFSPAGLVAFTNEDILTVDVLDLPRAAEREPIWSRYSTSEEGNSEYSRMESAGSVALSADGRLVASGSSDGLARVWDVASTRELSRLRHVPGGGNRMPGRSDPAVHAVAFSADASLLASGDSDGLVRVWQVASGDLVAVLQHGDLVSSVAFSPDGRLLASGSANGIARMWDVASGRGIALRHGDRVTSVAFSPDGRLLATGSGDALARVWRVASADQVAALRHGDRVNSVAFSPDGSMLATGSKDRLARIWVTGGPG